jgi:hypothetical protein
VAERKRATGFILMDAAFAADSKFLRLARRAETPHQFAAAVGVFWLILGEARRGKSPLVDWDDFEEYADEIAALKEAKLLQEDGFDPEVFERWAPAYRVPNGTQRYPSVPDGRSDTKSTLTSGQVKSGQVHSNGVGGVGEGEPVSFIRYPSRPPERLPGEAVVPRHDGSHSDCSVCDAVNAAGSIEQQQAASYEDAIRKTREREAKS